MNDWYKKWFDERYLAVYSHRDTAEAREFVSRWPIWNVICGGGWCLDLGCGAGRYASAIASRGMNVLGIDLSEALLKLAAGMGVECNTHSAKILFVRGDMLFIPANYRFSLVVSLFTSFGYFDDNLNESVLRQIAGLLRPGGCLVLDLPNPDDVQRVVVQDPSTQKTVNGIDIFEERSIDQQLQRVNKRITIRDANEQFVYNESVRLYSGNEITNLLKSCNIELEYEIWGDYTGKPYNSRSPRQIFFGMKHG
jgi:SAM-dependent methyltransferase